MKFNLEQSLHLLEATPSAVQALVGNLSDEWTHCNEGEGTWSVFDILGHLIHGEKTDWIPRTRIILNPQANKHWAPYDRFAQEKESIGKTMKDLLLEFKEARARNIKEIRAMNIQEKDYSKTAIHPEFGEVTLKQMLATWVAHDLSHLSQINRVLAKQYKSEVGPWIEYLRIMK